MCHIVQSLEPPPVCILRRICRNEALSLHFIECQPIAVIQNASTAADFRRKESGGRSVIGVFRVVGVWGWVLKRREELLRERDRPLGDRMERVMRRGARESGVNSL